MLVICSILYSSCSNPSTQNINTQEVLKRKKQKQINFNIDLNLSDYPEKLIKNQELIIGKNLKACIIYLISFGI